MRNDGSADDDDDDDDNNKDPLTSSSQRLAAEPPAMPQLVNARGQAGVMPTAPIILVEPHTSSTPRTFAVPETPWETASSDPNDGGGDLDSDDNYAALPEPDDQNALTRLLYGGGIRHADENVDPFWPYAKLRRAMTRERVLHALREECRFSEADAQKYCSEIMPADSGVNVTNPAADSVRWSKTGVTHTVQRAGYLRIFATLSLRGKGDLVQYFIEQGVSDRELPLKLAPTRTVGSARRNLANLRLERPVEPSPRPRGWFQWHEIEPLLSTQWRFLPPYFAPSANGDVAHYEIPRDAILPWVKVDNPSASRSTWTEGDSSGGYGVVKKVRIDPDCHSLGALLSSTSLPDRFFAIKSLRKSDIGEFEKEVEMLKRFGGTAHPHLVTLLATFTHDGRYHFIFPWAECDLEQWWSRSIEMPPNSLEFKWWIARQLSGLADAMYTIHEPKQGNGFLSVETDARVKKFGRHGDLKPENVLWFRSSKDALGVLVISDFGISAVHRDVSKSNVPNENLPRTPKYRPPECDMGGGKISRAFDIWTMGCIFLEMTAWLLDGKAGLEAFKRERLAPYLATFSSDIFFDIQEKQESGGKKYVFLVKEVVVKYMEKLHEHPACTNYLHHLLELVHDNMLVVISPTRQRIRAKPLSDRLRAMHQREDPAYFLQPAPWHGYGIERHLPVKAPLIANAQLMLAKLAEPGLTVFGNGATEAVTASEFSELQGD